MSKELILENITKKFGQIVAAQDINLEVKAGEFVCFLGPSGCGKTTTLRMIAGFERPTKGLIKFDGEVINDITPQNRNFGIVFQSYALFPHMSVFENIGFGLKMRKVSKDQITARIDELLNLVGLADQKYKYPPELSGGQQQRVALVRSLATYPQILLLDEPLSALDAQIRVNLRAEIKRFQIELGITMVYVTHDQEEALAISDRVIVMNQGFIEQIDKPIEIYQKPKTQFVAGFVGKSNFFEGELSGNTVANENTGLNLVVSQDTLRTLQTTSRNVTLAIRPEKVLIFKDSWHPQDKYERTNLKKGIIEAVTFLGVIVRIVVKLADKHIMVDITERRFAKSLLKMGDAVSLYFPPEDFLVFQSEREM
jgi:putative spermidine/putrescine transport system ATP-binding protein